MSLVEELTKLAMDEPHLRTHLVPLIKKHGSTHTGSAKPLQWSVDWSKIMDQILATYPITETPKGWVVSNPAGGSVVHVRSKAQAVDQALEWFMGNLQQVARHHKK